MHVPRCIFVVALLATTSPAWAQLVPGSLDVHWNEGAEDCAANTQPPIQVHRYNERTFILRENLCLTSEAPFMYLLVGSTKALLIDTGDIADPNQAPLAKTVTGLLTGDDHSRMPLIVVHTHGHLDHRAGDTQFEHLPEAQVVQADLDHVRRYFGFGDWPSGIGHLDLGDRTVDVMPAPGHHPAHVAFYDGTTGLFFSGDFLMPGRLLIDDAVADLASAKRLAAFVKERPVSHVLGGHIELDRSGETFQWGSHFHPQEGPLQLTKEDLVALPTALRAFNGFYTRRGSVILINPIRNLMALASLALVAFVVLGIVLHRYLRRRKAARKQRALTQA